MKDRGLKKLKKSQNQSRKKYPKYNLLPSLRLMMVGGQKSLKNLNLSL